MFTVIDGLVVRVDGAGTPVVLLHSGVADQRMWDQVADALMLDHLVIRYDMRGFGMSQASGRPYVQHSQDLAAVLDHIGLARVALVGNSFGGYVALDFASTWPHRVTHLALLAAPIDAWDWSPALTQAVARESELVARGDLETAARFSHEMWIRGPHREWTTRLRAVADLLLPATIVAMTNRGESPAVDDGRPPVAARLGHIVAPTLVGAGDRDFDDFAAIGTHLSRSIANARQLTFAGSGHHPPLEDPAGVAACVRVFLSGSGTTGRT